MEFVFGSEVSYVILLKFQSKAAGLGKAKSVTPYIIFASEIRKSIVEQNKARSFGEISRIVGDKVTFLHIWIIGSILNDVILFNMTF